MNNIVSFCFLPEAIIKILALGRMYFASAFNCFDFLVTIASVVAIFIPGASSISALRAVRVLRLLRLLTVVRPLQRFLRVMGKTIWMSMSLLVSQRAVGERSCARICQGAAASVSAAFFMSRGSLNAS